LSEAALSPEANRRSSFSSLICNTRSSRSLELRRLAGTLPNCRNTPR
jgi:hypothetical protein